MKELITTMTQRGQITVPAEIRRMLRLRPHDKVAFTVEDGEVRIVPVAFTAASAFSSIEPVDESQDFEDQIRQAKVERAERTIRSLSVR
ncbi:MAG: type II toxin-antitoxin system PrlF family antitoxin [Thermomicrobiales bacterium]|nr:type II toxin-antitoxin system PrlF family antitoxin [Thermomicrobiales bacterium]